MNRWMAALVMGVAGCVPTGSSELFLSASPASIRASGVATRVRVQATGPSGRLGQGTVKVRGNAGSAMTAVDLQLDKYGTATVDVSCDAVADVSCQGITSFVVSGTWSVVGETLTEVRADVKIVIDPPPPNAETTCDDFVDNDEDGLTDCADPDCEHLACDDNMVCTVDTVCLAGTCGGGGPRTCTTPPNPTCASGTGTCNPVLGCVYPAMNVGISCSDSSVCTTNERCDNNGLCTGDRVVCDHPPNECYASVGQCDSSMGCRYSELRDGTSCGTQASDRCCGGRCTRISSDTQNCGGCGVVCKTGTVCDDAVTPSSCGPNSLVTGRCTCASNTDCPGTQTCVTSRCSPLACRPYELRIQVDSTCPAYCKY